MLNFNIPQARHTTDHTVDIARSVPIETELGRRGIHLRRQGRELVGPCPVCGGCSGTDRFKVSTAKNVFNCFACDAGGDVIALVQQLDGSDFLGAVETLAGNATRYVDPAVTSVEGRSTSRRPGRRTSQGRTRRCTESLTNHPDNARRHTVDAGWFPRIMGQSVQEGWSRRCHVPRLTRHRSHAARRRRMHRG
jgi:hypothetical protein